jgi:hypothetical protein
MLADQALGYVKRTYPELFGIQSGNSNSKSGIGILNNCVAGNCKKKNI